MADVTTPSLPPQRQDSTSQPGQRARRRPALYFRGGRGGRGRGGSRQPTHTSQPAEPGTANPATATQQSQVESSLSLRSASVTPSHTGAADGSDSAQASSSRAAGRGRRRARGTGGLQQQHARVVNERSFGGQLTRDEDGDDSQTSLRGDASDFVPGQSKNPRGKGAGPPRQARPRRMSKSSAPDLATRIEEDINNRQYECAVCTSEVLRKSKIWSCGTCWTVFHLDCIKKWAQNSIMQNEEQNRNNPTPSRSHWRCPGCNLPQDILPSHYTCWCGKEHDTRSTTGLPPHSCGQTCGKQRLAPKKCPHPCDRPCHAGPCPPCTHMGPVQGCFCGKESSTKRCIDTDYSDGWSCGKICGEFMPCGEHQCERECHDGLCGACEVRIEGRCFCGKSEKGVLCCDKEDDEPCRRTYQSESGEIVTEEWTGIFQCPNECGRAFDCGKHHCKKPCHASSSSSTHCPRSPDVVLHCTCGKTPLKQLNTPPRKTCEDDIPSCSKPCLKLQPCGHSCPQICHEGPCKPCLERVPIRCRCGRTSSETVCHQGIEESPYCMRVCQITLNCGRHQCGERCCPGERKAFERQQARKKGVALGGHLAEFEAEHICTRLCERPLKCGNHTCQELCHRGPCGTCREAIFDEINCHCGRTVLQPPLPCGTPVPPCRFDCERSKDCGHPQVAHNCHTDAENCPKCPFLVERGCICGKKTMKNQKCWFSDVRCGEVCGKRLRCGSHFCKKTCHPAGECEDQDGPCQQPCGKVKKVCGHACEETCHAPFICKEEKPCSHKIIITCDCQRIKQEMKCLASKTSEGNITKSLKCDDECARLERNRRLALALDIDPATHTDDHIPYSSETLHMYQEHVNWSQTQEREFRVFAGSDDEKRLRFKPMSANQRSFIHSLAEDFGLDSESLDPEPHRHVAIFKTPRFVSAPSKLLKDCARIQNAQRVNAANEQRKAAAAAKASNLAEPFNGLLLINPRFALTIKEIVEQISASQVTGPKLSFAVEFLGSGDVALKLDTSRQTERDGEAALRDLKAPLQRTFSAHAFGTLELARFDESLNLVRHEAQDGATSGWSQVAAKAAAPRRTLVDPVVTQKNTFTVLSSLARKKQEQASAKKKKEAAKKEVVADDWEAAEDEAEQREAAQQQVQSQSQVDGGSTEMATAVDPAPREESIG